MSAWTHITATFDVDTFEEKDNLKEHVENQLKDAPRITGSEGNAQIFVNVLEGHNVFKGCDCHRCGYGNTVKRDEDKNLVCDADENFECPDGEYQTRVLISIIGDLRDRGIERTKREYKEFEKYISKTLGYWIRNKSVKISK